MWVQESSGQTRVFKAPKTQDTISGIVETLEMPAVHVCVSHEVSPVVGCMGLANKLRRENTGWGTGAILETMKPIRTSAPLRLHKRLTMTGYYCPSCARMLSLDIHEKVALPPHDLLLDLRSIESLWDRESQGL